MKNLLLDTLRVQTVSYKQGKMLTYIKDTVRNIDGCRIEQDGEKNIYVTKGEADLYPCIVAHTDTVHDRIPDANFKIYEDKNILFSIDTRSYKRTGIGGDDKVGVYIALRMLMEQDVCKAAFFVDEEVGCVGSSKADLSFFKDVNMAMQADRKNVREITSSIGGLEMYGKRFQEDIADIIISDNFIEVDGGLTDVKQLASALDKIPMFNAACGYYKPHTCDEYVNMVDVEDTFQFMSAVLTRTYGVDYGSDWKRESQVETWNQWDYGSFHTSNKYWKKPKSKYSHYSQKKIVAKPMVQKEPYWIWDAEESNWKVSKVSFISDPTCHDCKSIDMTLSSTSNDAWCNQCGLYHYDGSGSVTPF